MVITSTHSSPSMHLTIHTLAILVHISI
jgi:hypothetical protein